MPQQRPGGAATALLISVNDNGPPKHRIVMSPAANPDV
jgi:hypothetical protein